MMMKNQIYGVLFFFIGTLGCFATEVTIFVPENGKFVAKVLELEVENTSINGISQALGYNKDQTYTFLSRAGKTNKIEFVIFKVFTEEIIYIGAERGIKSVNNEDVKKYLSDYNFKKEFGSYQIESTLTDGIKNRSLTLEFLANIFNQKINSKDMSFAAPSIGYTLYFTKGILTSFGTSDGLGQSAKSWKREQPRMYLEYRLAATTYQESESDVLNEINEQADAWSKTPKGFQNDYIDFHINKDGTVNFKMLMVAHYDDKMTLKEFKSLNKGRYQLSNEFNDQSEYKRTTYRMNKTLYSFDENGKMVNTYTSK